MKLVTHACQAAVFLLLSLSATAQNLVVNPGFEAYNNCPTGLSGIVYSPTYSNFPTATGWVNPLQSTSPDYLNSCAGGGTGVKVPYATTGFQQARNGDAYAGLILWEGSYPGAPALDFREYLQTRLSQPLVAGVKYCISFYVSPTISGAYAFNYVAVDNIGIHLSDTQVSAPTGYTLPLTHSLRNAPGNYLTDTTAWIQVSGIYIATGGEQWLTLGMLDGGVAPAFVQQYPAVADPTLHYRSYVYIDDVSVAPLAATDTVISRHDTLQCNTVFTPMLLRSVSGATCLWSDGSTNTQLNATDTGTYWCRAQLGCITYIDTFRIRYAAANTLNLGADKVDCQNQPVNLQANNTYTSYSWSTGQSTPSITASQSGTYILTVTDVCRTQADTVRVTIQPPTAPPIASDTAVCQGNIRPAPAVQGSNLRWYNSSTGGIGSAQFPFLPMETGLFTVYVSQTVGLCESPRVPVEVAVRYSPHSQPVQDLVLCPGDRMEIGSPNTNPVSMVWNTGTNGCCTWADRPGTYIRTVVNDCGVAEDTVRISASACDACVHLPTAFTPNGNGRNDTWAPKLTCAVTHYKLRVYNRWGALIFTSTSTATGWDGMVRGYLADIGTYVYVLEYGTPYSTEVKHLSGNVTVVR